MKNDILRLGIILCVITAIAAGILGFVNNITLPVIEQQSIIANDGARKEILPSAESFEKVEGDFGGNILEVYKGLSGGQEIGYTIKSTSSGYGGMIEIVTGISTDGIITGVAIGNMAETPGLGAKAADIGFRGQYTEKEASELMVAKSSSGATNEIIAISGATITSKAVTTGVNESIALFQNQFNN